MRRALIPTPGDESQYRDDLRHLLGRVSREPEARRVLVEDIAALSSKDAWRSLVTEAERKAFP